MTVLISPNIKKESVRIDPSGNIINPRTKQITQKVEPEYVASPVPPTDLTTTPAIAIPENKIGSKIDEMINKKIEELVAKKIEEALSKL